MILTEDSNTINLKLFPTRPPPPPIHSHHVPLLTISLSSLSSPISSDLTLNRILPFINGVNSISRIAALADTDLSLTRRAVQHLVYYGCLVLLDVFSFGAIYAPTAEISGFVVDDDVKDEQIEGVPEFWYQTLSTALGRQIIQPHDLEPLKYLSDVRYYYDTERDLPVINSDKRQQILLFYCKSRKSY